MFRNFIEWTEGDPARGRKTILFSTIFVYLIIMIIMFGAGLVWPTVITGNIIQLFGIVTGLMMVIYAFYTSTSSTKSKDLADNAAADLIKKLDDLKGKK